MNITKPALGVAGAAICALIGSSAVEAQVTTFSDSMLNDSAYMLPPAKVHPTVWSFDDCLQWAFSNNTDLWRTELNIATARQDMLSAKDAWLPTVDFTTSHNYTNYPVSEPGRTGNAYGSNYNIGASWTVWDGNIRKYRIESAKLVEQQQQLAGDDIVRTLKLGILEAYLNIIYADEAVKIAQQTLQVSTTQTERARKLTQAGRMSRVECAQLESQQAQDKYNLTIAQSNYDSAVLALKKILALGLDTDLQVHNIQISDIQILSELPNRQEVFAKAMAWLPQFKSNRLAKDIYANDVKIAKASRMPSIALQGNVGSGYATGGIYSWGSAMSHNLNENIGLTVKIPIFDGNSTKRAVAKAKIAQMDYDVTQTELINNLSQTIEDLYINATNARAKYQAGLSQLASVQLTDELVNRQFELGYVNPLELLTAHNNLLNARLELLQSKYMALLASKTIDYYATEQLELK